MIKNTIVLKLLLIFVSFTVLSFGNMTVFTVLGIVILLGGMFASFKQGLAMGHEACAVSSSLERIMRDGDKQPEERMVKQAFSLSKGVKAIFGSALPGYLINCAYIVIMLMKADDVVLGIARLVSFIAVIPYWPVLNHWHEVYNVLTWDIVLLLMVSPFILPVCQYIGYRKGPEMWAKTEKAMADGKRRAKARSRIVRKRKPPKGQRPEI